ncbi:serine hydrolase [Pannus brasiliensis CCIBt3594]|uniref:Serine hydrolase n=1 Tax=Pannus brasiliensis CCIBt3594 TaxID=1427578 RepID=A0AAW9QIQ2_9CHRO
MTRTVPPRTPKARRDRKPANAVVPTDPKRRPQRKQRKPNPIATSFLLLLRFAILGVGFGAIAGTLLTVIDPDKIPFPKFQSAVTPATPLPVAGRPVAERPAAPRPATLAFQQEQAALTKKLQDLTAKSPKLQAAALFIDLDNGSYSSLQGDSLYPAASTIKVPVLVAFFEDVDAGKIHLDEPLVASKDVLASGSGDMQYLGENKTYTALETATKMIIISDNTATNMLIKRLGGKEVLNQRFKAWGLTHTAINNALPDLEGTNTTSPKDLVTILGRVSQGELISLKSRDRMLSIMRETRTRTLLPPGLEKGAEIAHKTGDIGTVLGDAGIIDMPNGKRYLGAVMVKRPHNDPAARTLIQQISRTAYQHFKSYQTKPAPPKPNPPAAKTQPSPTPSPQKSPERKP